MYSVMVISMLHSVTPVMLKISYIIIFLFLLELLLLKDIS